VEKRFCLLVGKPRNLSLLSGSVCGARPFCKKSIQTGTRYRWKIQSTKFASQKRKGPATPSGAREKGDLWPSATVNNPLGWGPHIISLLPHHGDPIYKRLRWANRHDILREKKRKKKIKRRAGEYTAIHHFRTRFWKSRSDPKYTI